MAGCNKKVLIAIGLAIIVVLIIGLAVGLSSSRGGTQEQLHLPDLVNGSLCPATYGPRPLLLVSLDGFRADYLQMKLTPSIYEIADKGVHAEYLMPSYPTVTYPNHYTIVTGLYPEAHGIIANTFYDPEFQKIFKLGSNESREGKWWGGEPIWNTVTRQNKKSATFFWPGSDADINKKRPNYWEKYNGSRPYEERVLKVLDWLQLEKDLRPSFVSLYFDEPDHAGHGHGPDSKEVLEQLTRVDKVINLLMSGLKERNLINCVNVIILSDHGMTEAGSKRVIDLMEYLPNLRDDAYYQRSVVSRINPKNKTEEVAEDMMEKLACKGDENKPMRVYLREGVPKRLHFSNNSRIEDILLELDLGFTTQFNSSYALMGQHGYDNYYSDMNAIFIAYGPDFKPTLKIQPFQNIEIYNLMCQLLEISPAPNNGTLGSLNHVLKYPPVTPQLPQVQKPPVLKFPKAEQIQSFWNISGCDKDNYTQQQWMSPLSMTENEEKTIEGKHLPWGIPQADTSDYFSLLYHPDHVTGFSAQYKMPLWTSFTLNPEDTDKVWHEPSMNQWTSDVRIPEKSSPTCQTFVELEESGYVMFTLFPTTVAIEQSQSKSASHLVSNAIPVHAEFKENWLELMNILPYWTKSKGPMNILMGPVLDTMDNPEAQHLLDKKIYVPSDLYVILTHCMKNVTSLNDCHGQHLDTRSFILHQYQPVSNCYNTTTDYLNKFSATVKDVERFTDFIFFPDLPYYDRVNLTLRAHPDIWLIPNVLS